MRRILLPLVVITGAVVASCGGTGSAGSTSDVPSTGSMFAPMIRRTRALDSVTVDTSLDAYPADGSQLRGTADTIVDFTTGQASGGVEILPATDFLWWREGDGVFLQGLAVDISGMTITLSEPDPSWSPPSASRAAAFGAIALLGDARAVHRATSGGYTFTLPMPRLDHRLRVAMQLLSPNLGDAFAGLTSRYTRGTGTAYVSHGRIVRVEFVFHGPASRPSAAVTIGLSHLGRSRPELSPEPLTSRPVT